MVRPQGIGCPDLRPPRTNAGYAARMPHTPISDCRTSYNCAAAWGFRAIARITVVNDDPDFLALMDEILASLNHESVVLSAKVATPDSIAATRPDLLFLDLRSSGDPQRGWDLAIAVRQHPGLSETPVVLSTGDHAFLREREDQIGALPDVHRLPKPFSVVDVEELLDRLLDRSDSA